MICCPGAPGVEGQQIRSPWRVKSEISTGVLQKKIARSMPSREHNPTSAPGASPSGGDMAGGGRGGVRDH